MFRKVTLETQLCCSFGGTDPILAPYPVSTMFSTSTFEVQVPFLYPVDYTMSVQYECERNTHTHSNREMVAAFFVPLWAGFKAMESSSFEITQS
jgi:hypothetical protein